MHEIKQTWQPRSLGGGGGDGGGVWVWTKPIAVSETKPAARKIGAANTRNSLTEMPDNTLIRKRTNRNEYASLSCSTTRIWECRISTMKRLLSFSQNKARGAENDGTNTDRKIKRVNADGNRQKTFHNHISNSSRPPTCNGCHPMPF